MASLLKPVGELINVDDGGGHDADGARVVIRVRPGRTLPCTVICDLGIRKHQYRLVMEEGQAPLPWGCRRKAGKRKREVEGGEHPRSPKGQVEKAGDKEAPAASTGQVVASESQEEARRRKGKALVTEVEVAPARAIGARPKGIWIAEGGCIEDRAPVVRDGDDPVVTRTTPPLDRRTKAPRVAQPPLTPCTAPAPPAPGAGIVHGQRRHVSPQERQYQGRWVPHADSVRHADLAQWDDEEWPPLPAHKEMGLMALSVTCSN